MRVNRPGVDATWLARYRPDLEGLSSDERPERRPHPPYPEGYWPLSLRE
jgi:hypothetical protein